MSAPRPISARSARTLYNAADALVPPDPGGGQGAGDVDLVPAVAGWLRGRGVGAARRLWAVLALLEQWPRISLRSRQGFSSLPLEARRAALESWRQSRLPGLRDARARLEVLVRESLAALPQSEDGA